MADAPPPWTTERPRILIQVRSLDENARKKAISALNIQRPDDHALLVLAYEQTLREAEAENEQLRAALLPLDPPPTYETKEERIARPDTCDHGILLLCTCYECTPWNDPER